jgi:alkanesulfonate monooxygenase SsuD/methylene tetrahydromethanopterin reductase-like flavin-dependent oxidoreductase (luciferase family)
MKFSFTHHMQYDHVTDSGPDWPVPNRLFDPALGAANFREHVDHKIFAEECGFDWVACNEHHMSPYGLMPNPSLIGAIVAHQTKKVGVLQSGSILPLNNPVRVAEEYAMIDVLSGGRLVAGFMRGIPHEYVAYNVDPGESYGRMYEAIDLIKKCWTEPEPFGWEGEFYQFRAVSIWPRPVQKMPTIVMSGDSDLSLQLCAMHRSVLGILRLPSVEFARAKIADYRALAAKHGWTPGPEHLMIAQQCVIADTDKEARALFAEGVRYFNAVLMGGQRTAQQLVLQKTRYLRNQEQVEKRQNRLKAAQEMSLDERIEKGVVICGAPDTAVRQITALQQQLGHGILNITCKIGNVPNAAVRRSMTYLRDEVFPKTRHLGQSAAKEAAA